MTDPLILKQKELTAQLRVAWDTACLSDTPEDWGAWREVAYKWSHVTEQTEEALKDDE